MIQVYYCPYIVDDSLLHGFASNLLMCKSVQTKGKICAKVVNGCANSAFSTFAQVLPLVCTLLHIWRKSIFRLVGVFPKSKCFKSRQNKFGGPWIKIYYVYCEFRHELIFDLEHKNCYISWRLLLYIWAFIFALTNNSSLYGELQSLWSTLSPPSLTELNFS